MFHISITSFKKTDLFYRGVCSYMYIYYHFILKYLEFPFLFGHHYHRFYLFDVNDKIMAIAYSSTSAKIELHNSNQISNKQIEAKKPRPDVSTG